MHTFLKVSKWTVMRHLLLHRKFNTFPGGDISGCSFSVNAHAISEDTGKAVRLKVIETGEGKGDSSAENELLNPFAKSCIRHRFGLQIFALMRSRYHVTLKDFNIVMTGKSCRRNLSYLVEIPRSTARVLGQTRHVTHLIRNHRKRTC